MAIYELTVHENYVQSWGVVEGLREILQNSLDQQTVDNTNTMYMDYDRETQTLFIGNKKSELEKDTLLLGYTTKANDRNTIGQFGEGYKLALLVLQREGKQVIIRNNAKREEWTVRLKRSRRYNNNKILTIDIRKLPMFKKQPNHNLVFEIVGITEEEYALLQNLKYSPSDLTVQTKYGLLDLSGERKGEIYYKGLKVHETEKFGFCYNIEDVDIRIGRDRNIASESDITYATTLIWSELYGEPKYQSIINDLINNVALMDIYAYQKAGIHELTRLFDPHYKQYEQFLKLLGEEKVKELEGTGKIYKRYGAELSDLEQTMEVEYVSPTVENVLVRNQEYVAYEAKLKERHIETNAGSKEEQLYRILNEVQRNHSISEEAYTDILEAVSKYSDKFALYSEKEEAKKRRW